MYAGSGFVLLVCGNRTSSYICANAMTFDLNPSTHIVTFTTYLIYAIANVSLLSSSLQISSKTPIALGYILNVK